MSMYIDNVNFVANISFAEDTTASPVSTL